MNLEKAKKVNTLQKQISNIEESDDYECKEEFDNEYCESFFGGEGCKEKDTCEPYTKHRLEQENVYAKTPKGIQEAKEGKTISTNEPKSIVKFKNTA